MEVIGGYRFSQIVEGHRKHLSGITDSVLDRRGNVKDSIVLLDGPSKHWAGFNFSRFIFSGAIIADSPSFFDSNFEWAKFSHCQMRGATFMDCNFNHADLDFADLTGSTFIRCNFEGATMRDTTLACACFQDCTNIPYIPMTCPEEDAFFGYKLATFIHRVTKEKTNGIVTVYIPRDAKRSSAYGRKCRCNKATVIGIERRNGEKLDGGAYDIHSWYDSSFVYHVGDTIFIDDFEEDRWDECAPGFHFFINKEEARRYG